MKKLIIKTIRYFNKKKFGHVGNFSEIPITLKKISNPKNVFIGSYVKIGSNLMIYTSTVSKVVIKDGTIFGPNCKIYTCSHNYDNDNLKSIPYDNINICADVIINEACWLGDSVIILPGVSIGKGAVVGAGSIVTKDIPDYAVVAGNPSKILKFRDSIRFDFLLTNQKFTLNTPIRKEFKGKYK